MNKTQRIVLGGQLSGYRILNFPKFIFHMLLHTDIKGGKKVKMALTWHKRQPEHFLASELETSSHYFLNIAFDALGRISGKYTLDQVSCMQPPLMSNLL